MTWMVKCRRFVGGSNENDVDIVARIVRNWLVTREDGSVYLSVEAVKMIADALEQRGESVSSRH